MWLLANTPVLHDIPLPLPADRALLIGVLVMLFLTHILFVNLMLGGSLLTLAFEVVGHRRRDADLDALALEIAKTTTVNKSLAVVLGVGPLLAINVVYTVFFYSANALTGMAWISIVPLVATAFLLLYLHKYTWHTDWMVRRRVVHVAIGGLATAILLMVPFIFLTNINLMLFPDRWGDVRGFHTAVLLPNVLPRYLHFLLASVAVTGLALAWYFGRSRYPFEERFASLRRPQLVRTFYKVALGVSLVQFLAGPLVLLTFPPRGVGLLMIGVFLTGATLAATALYLLWLEIRSSDEEIGGRFFAVVGLLTLTVICMASGRHMYREKSLIGPQVAMAIQSSTFAKEARDAKAVAEGALSKMAPDERLFTLNCSACHAIDTVRSAPSVREIATIHRGNPQAIVEWAIKPGRKRPEFSEMPSMARLGQEKLLTIAKYMLRAGSASPTAGPASGPVTSGAVSRPSSPR
ncbi:MAG: cytochrome C [Phycisphaerae bacterium]|nr:cytochrome C [Phycisphaerae bacterium]